MGQGVRAFNQFEWGGVLHRISSPDFFVTKNMNFPFPVYDSSKNCVPFGRKIITKKVIINNNNNNNNNNNFFFNNNNNNNNNNYYLMREDSVSFA